MLNKSPELKAQRGYKDPKSFVRLDGSEVLKGKDWKARVEELRLRCRGRCEQIVNLGTMDPISANGRWQPFERCKAHAQDPHHIIRRSVKRDDRLENLQALCRFHHDLLDHRKPRWSKRSAA